MRTKLFIYNRYGMAIDQFEDTLQEFIATAPDVVGMSAQELSSGRMLIKLDLAETRTKEQEVCILAWLDPNRADELLSNTLDQVAESGKTARLITVTALSDSPRLLAAMIVEPSRVEATSAEKDEQQRDAQIQDEGVNAKPKRRAKRNVVAPN